MFQTNKIQGQSLHNTVLIIFDNQYNFFEQIKKHKFQSIKRLIFNRYVDLPVWYSLWWLSTVLILYFILKKQKLFLFLINYILNTLQVLIVLDIKDLEIQCSSSLNKAVCTFVLIVIKMPTNSDATLCVSLP